MAPTTAVPISTGLAVAYFVSLLGLQWVMGDYASIFAFGLVAFGFLCMGPVNIAVDSYGPVTDNAQSVFESSMSASFLSRFMFFLMNSTAR